MRLHRDCDLAIELVFFFSFFPEFSFLNLLFIRAVLRLGFGLSVMLLVRRRRGQGSGSKEQKPRYDEEPVRPAPASFRIRQTPRVPHQLRLHLHFGASALPLRTSGSPATIKRTLSAT